MWHRVQLHEVRIKNHIFYWTVLAVTEAKISIPYSKMEIGKCRLARYIPIAVFHGGLKKFYSYMWRAFKHFSLTLQCLE
jgi:hypothetical protein